MSFKQLYIIEAMKFNRYEKYIPQVLKALKDSLYETMPYLKDLLSSKSVDELRKNHFKLKLDFQKFKAAYDKIDNSSDFEKYAHKFIMIQVPKYNSEDLVDISFYFSLNNDATYGGLSSTKKPEILIVLNTEKLLWFLGRDSNEIREYIEDVIVHELTHIIDPSTKSKKFISKTLKANIKADNGDEDEYFKLPWEKTAFHTQNVRRVINNIIKDKEFHTIANERNVSNVTSYLMNKIKNLKEYLDTRVEIRDRNKIYKELYKEVSDIVELYKKSIEER